MCLDCCFQWSFNQVCNLFLRRFEMCFGDVRRALLKAFDLEEADVEASSCLAGMSTGIAACRNVMRQFIHVGERSSVSLCSGDRGLQATFCPTVS